LNKLLILICCVSLLTLSCFANADKEIKPVPPKGSWTKKSVYKCMKATCEITLDGRVDEAAWKNAVVIPNLWQANFWYYGSGKDVKGFWTTQKTKVRLLYDEKYVYISAEMEDTDLLAMTTTDDAEFKYDGTDDLLEIFFQPDNKKPGYYEFHVSPSNCTRDIYYPRRFGGHHTRFIDYASGMETAVSLDGTLNNWHDTDIGWSVEVRIPWNGMTENGPVPKPGDRWKFNICRYNFAVQLPYGNELGQLFWSDRISFHQYEEYPWIEFVK